MMQKVKYNGGTGSYYYADDPGVLVKGRVYEVLSKKDLGFQTNIRLRGIPGEFNHVWFDEVSSAEAPKVFMAISREEPQLGRSMRDVSKVMEDGSLDGGWTTSRVVKIIHLTDNIFDVYTWSGSRYLLQVIR